jgi:hypothetical protein
VAAGLADAGIAVVTMAFSHVVSGGLTGVAGSWATYALMVGGPCSLLLTQTAYQAGRPMITLPVIAVATPVASLAAGNLLLGESAQLGVLGCAVAALAVVVTSAGLVVLARLTTEQPAAAGGHGSSITLPAFPASGSRGARQGRSGLRLFREIPGDANQPAFPKVQVGDLPVGASHGRRPSQQVRARGQPRLGDHFVEVLLLGPADTRHRNPGRIQSGSLPTARQTQAASTGAMASTFPTAAVHLSHPMSRDALVSSRHTPVSPRNLKRRRRSAAAAAASGKDAR